MAYYTVAQKRAFQEKLDKVFNECIEELNAIEVPFRRITDVTVNYRLEQIGIAFDRNAGLSQLFRVHDENVGLRESAGEGTEGNGHP